MHCPRDNTPLEIQSSPCGVYYECPVCDGLLVPLDTLCHKETFDLRKIPFRKPIDHSFPRVEDTAREPYDYPPTASGIRDFAKIFYREHTLFFSTSLSVLWIDSLARTSIIAYASAHTPLSIHQNICPTMEIAIPQSGFWGQLAESIDELLRSFKDIQLPPID
ncbi:MAG: hypothetical protein LAT58_11720 [Opitutales bacterium]|nr:hypothetical protein [Opitutales bacterium]